mmetsp:Transcript_43038/g.111396  ORF Transcript_43038/g.111396 Transcript_43038/m.111396 type:complete len:106 (+) Transcript_43038:614-931(+)|eukprot:CAMPEP_0113896166 /NCGR_PEP_ID=MMETSP0780_2-20120614/17837_1 /TAXON_ID=652834 /ORGANISM="Palpitomonas bilix" /LENGTH=105 /DNA_ID=CAMNT_0000887217 /DNA_START=389 /DNA_END=706 /DNA_ORIENTATION=+ /assembly_acc=CAM_ASM_000599
MGEAGKTSIVMEEFVDLLDTYGYDPVDDVLFAKIGISLGDASSGETKDFFLFPDFQSEDYGQFLDQLNTASIAESTLYEGMICLKNGSFWRKHKYQTLWVKEQRH